MRKDYYGILGVSDDASTDEVKRAFRKLARETHPDANPGDPMAEARFREIAEAYEVLSDPQKRRAFDRGDALDLGELLGAGLDDLLRSVFGEGSMFGGGGIFGSQRQRRTRGRDILVPVRVTLAEAAFGTNSELTYHALKHCDVCGGSGSATDSGIETCATCGGGGAVRQVRRTVLGSVMSIVECQACEGSGTIIVEQCERCHAQGVVAGEQSVLVEIPAGVSDGTRLRLSGRGEAGGRRTAPGDLFVEVSVEPDPRFVRRGEDLLHRKEVGVGQAALGAELTIPLLGGGETKLQIPPGTQHGTIFRLSGRGMTRLGKRGRGELFVEVSVYVPESLSEAQQEALRKYAEEAGEEVADG